MIRRHLRSHGPASIATAGATLALFLAAPLPALAKCDPLDGVVAFAEECDDGNMNDHDACRSDCTWNTCGDGLACTDTSTAASACGEDGPTRLEECDKAVEHATCDADCTAAVCGDGYPNVAAGEECDDGNTKPGDGCEPDCKRGRDAALKAFDALRAASLVEVEAWIEHGLPTSLSMQVPVPAPSGDPVTDALGFLYEYRDLFRIDDPEKELYLDRAVLDEDLKTFTFGQKVGGVRVSGGEIVVMISPDGDIVGTHGRWHPELPAVAEEPGLTQPDAEAAALEDGSVIDGKSVAGETRLEYFDPGFALGAPSLPRLAWRVVVEGTHKETGETLADVYVDAFTSEVLSIQDHQRSAKDYDLNTASGDTSTTCFSNPFSDPSVQWFTERGTTSDYPGRRFPGGDADGDLMWFQTEAAYAYWLRTFNWRGWDGSDEQIEAYVHYGIPAGTLPNAFANTTCIKFTNGMATPDIYAHEYAHGIDKETADLRYRFESGAISEAFADFFGVAATGYTDWFLGEGSVRGSCSPGAPAGAFRNMADPPSCAGDPDHYSNYLSVPESNDNGGVHTNSGIVNKALFLMSAGGTHRGVTVPPDFGQGRTAFYLFKAMRQRLSSEARMIDLRNEFLNGMRGVGEPRPPAWFFTPQEMCAVRNAFGSVGLGVTEIDSDCDGAFDVEEGDDDNDGIPDARDNCRLLATMNQADLDGDGVGDACDPDDDGDGVCNFAGPVLSGAPGVGSGCSRSPSGRDNCPRFNEPDQSDFDRDGVGDACEDSDGDGLLDLDDNCPAFASGIVSDVDRDEVGDVCDPDSDNDEICNSPPARGPAPGTTAGCGLTGSSGDFCPYQGSPIGDRVDVDGDAAACMDPLPIGHPDRGCGDLCDNCPDHSNPTQADLDRDGVGDACDDDRDGDGVANDDDNCPDVRNAAQADIDGDGVGFGCDADDWEALVNPTGTLRPATLTFPSTTSPLEFRLPACIPPDCSAWLAPDRERRLLFELPKAMAMRIVDDNGDVVASAEPALNPKLRFQPDPEWRYVSPKIPPASTASNPKGALEEEDVFEGRSYTLQIFPSPDTIAGFPYPVKAGAVEPLHCTRAPIETCKVAMESGRSPLTVKAAKGDRKITWKIAGASAATPADFGDPTAGGSYALCFYEDGESSNLGAELLVPGGGTCGAKEQPCWSALQEGKKSAGWRFADDGTHDGVRSIVFKGGGNGKSSLTVKAVGQDVPVPLLPATLPMRVQLQTSEGACWQAAYLPGSVTVNDEDSLVGKGS